MKNEGSIFFKKMSETTVKGKNGEMAGNIRAQLTLEKSKMGNLPWRNLQ